MESASSELVTKLITLPISRLQQLRHDLFEDARTARLIHQHDVIVQRQKRANGPRIEQKLAVDIATLIYHLRNETSLPRTLLRNGKRSKLMYEQSRNRPPVRNQPRNQLQKQTLVDDTVQQAYSMSQFQCDQENTKSIQYTMAMVNQSNEQQPSVFNASNQFTRDTSVHSNQHSSVCITDNQSTNDVTTHANRPPTVCNVDNLSTNDTSTHSNVAIAHLSQLDSVPRLEQCIDSAPGNVSCSLNSQQLSPSNNSEYQLVECSQYHTSAQLDQGTPRSVSQTNSKPHNRGATENYK